MKNLIPRRKKYLGASRIEIAISGTNLCIDINIQNHLFFFIFTNFVNQAKTNQSKYYLAGVRFVKIRNYV